MQFEVNVSNVTFIIDADDDIDAETIVTDILNEHAYDWGTVSVA